MAIHVVKEPVPKPGTLGRTELYALAIGQVIGAGVITLIVPAIKMTGYSAWLAYFVAILMGFVMILPFVFISSMESSYRSFWISWVFTQSVNCRIPLSKLHRGSKPSFVLIFVRSA